MVRWEVRSKFEAIFERNLCPSVDFCVLLVEGCKSVVKSSIFTCFVNFSYLYLLFGAAISVCACSFGSLKWTAAS